MPLLASLHFSHCLHRFTLDAIQINLITCSLTWQTNIRILVCAQKKKNISFYLMIKKVQISKGDPSFVSLLQFGVIKEDMFLSIK